MQRYNRTQLNFTIKMTARFLIPLIFFLSSLFFWAVQPARADHQITVILSSRLQPYVESLQGFTDTIGAAVPTQGTKSIQYATITKYVLSEEKSQGELHRRIASHPPQLFVAIGTNALSFLINIRDIPIIYFMVPFPEAIIGDRRNISGISLQISPARQLALLHESFPSLRRLGLIHDPDRTGNIVAEIKDTIDRETFSLAIREAHDDSEVHTLLDDLAGRIDVLWMLPDLTVTTHETTELIYLFSLEHRVPVLTFSTKYLQRGAAFAVTFDTRSIGATGAEITRLVLAGTDIGTIPAHEPEKIELQINRKVTEKLGLTVFIDAKDLQ